MDDRAISIRRLIRWLENRRTAEALKTMEGGVSYEDYLKAVGKFRGARSLIQMLEKQIEKDSVPEPEAEEIDDLEEEEDEEEVRPRRSFRSKPRGWGG